MFFLLLLLPFLVVVDIEGVHFRFIRLFGRYFNDYVGEEVEQKFSL